MGKITDYLKGNTSTPAFIGENEVSEQEAIAFVKHQLEAHSVDNLRRLARYTVLENFIAGNHWGGDYALSTNREANHRLRDYGYYFSDVRPSGMEQVTFNKCGPAADKFIQFLAIHKLQPHVKKPVDFDVSLGTPKDQAANPEEIDPASQQAEIVEKIGRAVWYEDNDWSSVSRKWAEYSAKLGEGYVRSVWDPIREQVVKTPVDPRYITAWYKDNTYEDLAGVIYESRVDINVARMTPAQGGYNVDGKLDNLSPDSDAIDKTSYHRAGSEKENDVGVYDMWIDLSYYKGGELRPKCRNIIIVGDVLIKDEIIKDPFPYYRVRFKEVVGTPDGESAIAQGIALQRRLNEALSDEAEIIKQYSDPWIIDEGSGVDPNEIQGTGQGAKWVPIVEGGDIRFLQWQGSVYNITQHIDRISKAFDDVVGMPAIAYGTIDASLATGVALTTSFQPTIQKIQDWAQNFEKALNKMWRDDLIRLENNSKKTAGFSAKDIIQGLYSVTWEWGERAPRDESLYTTTIINKKNAGLISDKTAMEKLGVPSPHDEQVQIQREKNNPFYNPEIALQKFQAYMQYEQMTQQALQPPQQAMPGAGIPGNQGGQAFTSAAPNLTPNLADTAQPFAQAGVGGGSNQAPQQTEQ